MLREPCYSLSDLLLTDHMHEENKMLLLRKYNNDILVLNICRIAWNAFHFRYSWLSDP